MSKSELIFYVGIIQFIVATVLLAIGNASDVIFGENHDYITLVPLFVIGIGTMIMGIGSRVFTLQKIQKKESVSHD